MAEKVGDAVLELGVDDRDLKKGLEDIEGETEKSTDSMVSNWKAVAAAAAAAAAAIAVGVNFMKAAEAERISTARLGVALRNVGVDYASVSREINSTLAALQRTTSYGDTETRAALTRLIYLTGDYSRAMEHLGLVVDMADAQTMDLVNTAQIVARVLQGNTTILTRYGITLREGATATEAIDALTKAFGGTASETASSFAQLANAMGDLKEAIGELLTPLMPLVNLLTRVLLIMVDITKTQQGLTQEYIKSMSREAMLNPLKAIEEFNEALERTSSSYRKVINAASEFAQISYPYYPPGSPQEKLSKMRITFTPKEYKTGGIVPGPIGRPQMAMVHGGEIISQPGGMGGITVNVYNAGSVITERDLTETIRSELLKIKGRNVSYD